MIPKKCKNCKNFDKDCDWCNEKGVRVKDINTSDKCGYNPIYKSSKELGVTEFVQADGRVVYKLYMKKGKK